MAHLGMLCSVSLKNLKKLNTCRTNEEVAGIKKKKKQYLKNPNPLQLIHLLFSKASMVSVERWDYEGILKKVKEAEKCQNTQGLD